MDVDRLVTLVSEDLAALASFQEQVRQYGSVRERILTHEATGSATTRDPRLLAFIEATDAALSEHLAAFEQSSLRQALNTTALGLNEVIHLLADALHRMNEDYGEQDTPGAN